MIKDRIIIATLRYPTIKKCEVCDRVKDIYFKAIIKDCENPEFEVGSLNCCKECGQNLNEILENKEKIGETVVKEFNFSK